MIPPTVTSPTRHTSSGSEAAGMGLIHDVRQQVAVADDDLALRQCGADHFLDKLRPRGHEQQHLAAAVNRRGVVIQQDLPQPFAERRAARIAAGDDLAPALAQGLGQQADLRRFADAIDAVEAEEHG